MHVYFFYHLIEHQLIFFVPTSKSLLHVNYKTRAFRPIVLVSVWSPPKSSCTSSSFCRIRMYSMYVGVMPLVSPNAQRRPDSYFLFLLQSSLVRFKSVSMRVQCVWNYLLNHSSPCGICGMVSKVIPTTQGKNPKFLGVGPTHTLLGRARIPHQEQHPYLISYDILPMTSSCHVFGRQKLPHFL